MDQKDVRQEKGMNTLIVSIKDSFRNVSSVVLFLCVCLMVSGTILGQRDETSTKTGAIAGNAYSYSNFETINMTNGNLSLNIPLGSLPSGRGNVGGSIGLTYNSKLFQRYDARLRKYDDECEMQGPTEEEVMVCPAFNAIIIEPKEKSGWQYTGTYSLDFENRLDARGKYNTNVPSDPNEHLWPSCRGAFGFTTNWWAEQTWIWKMRLVLPDGSTHEMIPAGYNSEFNDGFYRVRPDGLTENCGIAPSGSHPNPLVYYTVDGSFLRLEKTSTTDWVLYMPDGSRVVNTSSYQRVYDKNGNYVQYTTTSITDQFDRTVSRAGTNFNEIKSVGVDGEEITWSIEWKTIAVKKSYTTCNASGAGDCPVLEEVRVFEEYYDVVSRIIMPDQLGGGEYVFSYNAPDYGSGPPFSESEGWGEISSVTLPTGAVIDYEYDLDGVTGTFGLEDFDRIFNNHVKIKTLTYDSEYDGTSTPVVETWGYAIRDLGYNYSTITNPNGSWTKVHFIPDGAMAGTITAQESSDGSIVENMWVKNPPVDCGIYCWIYQYNPYMKTTFTSIKDAAGNYTLTAIKDFTYDKNGNVTEVREYDWVAYSSVPRDGYGSITGIPGGATLKRVTKTEFYNPVPLASSSTYNDTDSYIFTTSPRLLRLPKSVEVQDGSSVTRSKTEITYDYTNYNSSNTKGGNPTLTRVWDSTKNSITTPLTDSNSIKTQATYNAYGMPLTTTDANGVVTQITYGNITTPTGTVSDLYPTQTIAAYGTALARTSTATYDFFTGAVLSATDEDNDVTVVTEYDDLGRRVKVRNAYGTALESWTTTEYDDELRRVVVRSDLNTKGDGQKVAIQHFDQLGRVRLARTLEVPGAENPYNEQHGIKVQTRYKASGACTFDPNEDCTFQLTSNPYRAATSGEATNEETMGWTLSQTRSDGRYSEVETFAGAALPSAFGGANTNSTGVVRSSTDANASTVEDQAGKKRRSITNALGQLIRVDEPNGAGQLGTVSSPNQATSYAYDTLNNLTTVNQGVQTRTFTYSSLSRLLSATNPESGTITYTYDNNGNLTKKTDARSIETEYEYDALNRITDREYSDSTPDVEYTYKTTAPGLGNLIKVESSVSTTEYTDFDILGRVTGHKQTTDGEEYETDYTYNLSGALVEQTYPSGRKVKNILDNNGDLLIVQSRKSADHGYWNYASGFTYNAAGAVTSMQLGNGRWESTQFNSRLQPTQIALGTVQNGSDKLKLQYGYGTTNNNGNILSQTITVPTVDTYTGFTAVQTYTYDSLNRIKDAAENVTPHGGSSSQSWKQAFTYDRYGNRNFDEAQTTTLVKNCGVSPNFTVCAADKKIVNPAINTTNNRLSTSDDYVFDNSGNTTEDAHGRTFIYDAENKQVGVKDQYNNTIGEYFYDGDGKRVKKYVPSTDELTVFVYDAGGKLIGEYSTVMETQNPKVSYSTSDHLGSPRILTDENGVTISRRDFHPFGEEIASTERIAALGYQVDDVRQKFTAYERDDETDLDFARARMYQSKLGRFSAVDPIFESIQIENPQSMNRYSYTINNPLIYIDPNGELWIIVKGKQNPQWVDECPENTLCFNALALENEKGGLNVYGSKGADDITGYKSNKDGQIDVRELSTHHDAQFIVADHQNIPEEFLSVNAAGNLFNIAELYSQEFKDDDKLVFTAGNLANGKPCPGCHSGHRGNDIDIRYMGKDGKPLTGDNAYKNADVNRTKWLINAGKSFGFLYPYTGDDGRFGLPDRSPKWRDDTEKVHRHHLHIGKTAPRVRKKK